jgi:tRNA(Arg) A34 adenosine deaminase TadA
MLTEAVKLAKENEVEGLPRMAAIISKRKRILGTGFNKRKTHPMMHRFTDNHLRVEVHAEIAAIINALRTCKEEDLKGAEIFIARVLKNGERGIAKPCTICQKALDTYGITAIHYTEYED